MADSRKRPYDSSTEQYASKRFNKDGDSFVLKQLVPSSLAGSLIGVKGETVTSINQKTGAVLKMSKGKEFYPGTTDRILMIHGNPDSVRQAHTAAWDILLSKDAEELQMKIVVPNATAGLIIGKKGLKIKQIKDETGAFIQVSQKTPDTQMLERVITIGGTPDQMMAAFLEVFDDIVKDQQNHPISDFRGPVANSNPAPQFATQVSHGAPMAGFDAHSMGFGLAAGTMGNAGFNLPHVANNAAIPSSNSLETLKAVLRNNGFSPLASDEITLAVCTLFKYGIINSPGFGLGGMGMGFGDGGQMNQCGVTLDGIMNLLSGADGRDNGRAMNNGGNVMGGGGGNTMFGDIDENLMAFGMGNNANTFEKKISKKFQIDERVVGAVLGRAGSLLVDIQHNTGTTIQITKKGEFAPGTRNRVATVTGTAGDVERAINMMKYHIELDGNKRS